LLNSQKPKLQPRPEITTGMPITPNFQYRPKSETRSQPIAYVRQLQEHPCPIWTRTRAVGLEMQQSPTLQERDSRGTRESWIECNGDHQLNGARPNFAKAVNRFSYQNFHLGLLPAADRNTSKVRSTASSCRKPTSSCATRMGMSKIKSTSRSSLTRANCSV
jgi:hypothetical protein